MVQKCGSANGNVDGVAADGVGHLAPVRGDHVRGGLQPGGTAEFGHDLASGEAAFRAAGVFGVGHHALHAFAQADGLVQEPGAVGIKGDPGLRETLGQGGHHVNLGVAGEHAALEFEVAEAVPFLGCFGQGHHGLGCHGFLSAELFPPVRRRVLHEVGQIRPAGVADEEQIAEHGHRAALLAVAEQFRDRNPEELSVQVKECGLDCGDGMDGGAQVEGLQAAAAGVAVGELRRDVAQQGTVAGHRLAGQEGAGFLDGGADLLPARHFAEAGPAV